MFKEPTIGITETPSLGDSRRTGWGSAALEKHVRAQEIAGALTAREPRVEVDWQAARTEG